MSRDVATLDYFHFSCVLCGDVQLSKERLSRANVVPKIFLDIFFKDPLAALWRQLGGIPAPF